MKKILVVDDDADILNVVDIMLTFHDFIVKTTSKWKMISKTIKTFIPDLILLDIDLRGADGGDLCIKLKKSKVTQHIPVILFSGLMPEDYLKACNAQGFLNKPFESSDLLEIIRHNVN
jgi:two-component system phosphate regulon response regulator PhoB